MGQAASRAANEAQRATDMGATAQSGGQQGRHLGEAHRSEKEAQISMIMTLSDMHRHASQQFVKPVHHLFHVADDGGNLSVSS